jgi:hypothetical protein
MHMKVQERKASAARRLWLPLAMAAAVAAALAACGGGGGGGDTSAAASTTTTATPTAATAVSSGVITAFGSVFVNGHRFRTDSARVVDDDTGAVTPGVTGLEVGMVVDLHQRADDASAADELHVHPLVRGYVDAASSTASTLTVMGQTVQLTAATTFSDHRSCLAAATPCTAISTAASLATTTVSGTPTTPGNYVTVHGFLFGGGTANVVATLVSVSDVPAGSSPANYKVEGVVNVAASGVTIGSLKLDLSKARCIVAGQPSACSALTNGSVVSAGSATAPALPATVLVADFARQSARLPVETAGAAVELEGVVSSAGTSSFVVRGVTVDASALPAGTAMPALGDEVRVTGTLSANGDALKASSLTTEHHAISARVTLQGDASNVAAGSTTGTFTLTVLGQSVTVNAQTRLADMSVRGWDRRDPTANPFNITTFQSYLAASASQHVMVVAEADASGALVAQSLAILPASNVVAVAGTVDATPAPVNSGTSGTPTVFFVHGVKVSADPAAFLRAGMGDRMMGMTTTTTTTTSVAAGDQVVAVGTSTGGAIVLGPTLSGNNRVLDLGAMSVPEDRDRGMF